MMNTDIDELGDEALDRQSVSSNTNFGACICSTAPRDKDDAGRPSFAGAAKLTGS